jgi:hypothetical protein
MQNNSSSVITQNPTLYLRLRAQLSPTQEVEVLSTLQITQLEQQNLVNITSSQDVCDILKKDIEQRLIQRTARLKRFQPHLVEDSINTAEISINSHFTENNPALSESEIVLNASLPQIMPDYFNSAVGSRANLIILNSDVTHEEAVNNIINNSLADESVLQEPNFEYFRTVYNDSIRNIRVLDPNRINQFRENINYLTISHEPFIRNIFNVIGFEVSIYSLFNLFSPAVLSFLVINFLETETSYTILTFFLGLARPLFLSVVNIRFWSRNLVSSIISVFTRIIRTVQAIRINDGMSPTFYRNLLDGTQRTITNFRTQINYLNNRAITVTNEVTNLRQWRRFVIRGGFLALISLLMTIFKQKEVILFILQMLNNILPNSQLLSIIENFLSTRHFFPLTNENLPIVNLPLEYATHFLNNFDNVLTSVVEYMSIFMQ